MKQKPIDNIRIIRDSDKRISWEDDAERLVLYADIMGFSHRVTFNNHEELKRDLQKFKQSWELRIKPLEKG